MRTDPRVAWQPMLGDAAAEPTIDATFAASMRHQLDATSWVDVVPGWVECPGALFATMLDEAKWASHERRMYDAVVTEPRLRAPTFGDERLLRAVPLLDDMRRALSTRYAVAFTSGGANLYRDGRDSVAWHADRIPKEIVDPIVAIVSLGAPRRFLLRPKVGGASVRLRPGPGDLLVTGGTAQRTWEHTVPKVASAGPRISITFRHR